MNKSILSIGLAFGLMLSPTVAFAEEVVEEAPIAEEPVVVEEVVVEEPAPEPAPEPEPTPEPEPEPTPEPEPEYVPPPEASEGVGGWAVVDPRTGKVHGVIVGSMKTYESRNGVIGHEYMGCAADCVLRFQTRATADGNVAGYGSSGNTEVKFNESDKTFSITDNVGDGGKSVSVLVPEKTARDEAGMDLSTGIVSRNITKKNEDADIEIAESYLDEKGNEVRIEYVTWGADKKLFNYINGREALSSLRSDVDDELLKDFSTTQDRVITNESTIITESIDEETGEAVITEETIITEETVTDTVIDEDNAFVKAIRTVTDSVISFFNSLFGN